MNDDKSDPITPEIGPVFAFGETLTIHRPQIFVATNSLRWVNRICGKVLEQAYKDIYSHEVEWREVPEFNEEDLQK